MKENARSVVLVGAGMMGTIHWIPAVARSAPFRLIGIVDPDKTARNRAVKAAPGTWAAGRIGDVQPADRKHAIAFVATPDHFPVIRELANHGFQEFIVEKPLVSRESEPAAFEKYVRAKKLKVYSIDHYYQKFLPLEFVLGRLAARDPRAAMLAFHGDHAPKEISGILGVVEAVTYTNIEGGDLGLPTLDNRPWLEHDAKIGGMLRDLGPHAFAPLMRVGLVSPEPAIAEIDLAKFNKKRDGFAPVRSKNDIEMWVRTLLVSNGITTNITFGKTPFSGKERSLAVRAKNGVFFAGLSRGQSSVLVTNDGRTTRISLIKPESDLVLEEAMAFFNKKLPKTFDGNVHSSLTALRLNERLRSGYLQSIK